MVTNQMMTLTLNGTPFNIEHKTKMGSLTQLWKIGNDIRVVKGLKHKELSHYLRMPETQETVDAIERKLGIFKCAGSADMQLFDPKQHPGTCPTVKSPLIIAKRGRYGGTWAHLYVLIDGAANLDADFKIELYAIFVEGRYLDWRDMGGDEYKAMNNALAASLPGTQYQWLASVIASKVGVHMGEWNEATRDQLIARLKLESGITTLLQSGLVTSQKQLEKAIYNLS